MSDPEILPPEGFVSMAEAVRRLGKSDRTIRRLIEAGKLEAERVVRPQGTVLFVKIPTDAATHAAAPPAAASDQESGKGGDQTASEPDLRTIDLLISLNETARAKDAQLAGYVERIAALEREAGELTWRVHAQEREILRLEAEVDRLEAAARRPWWRFW